MKKRILMLVAVVLVIATALTAFTACKTDYVKTGALTLNEDAEPATELAATKIDLGADYEYEWNTSKLIAFSKTSYNSSLGKSETTYTVVNAETGANILSGYDRPANIVTTDYTVVMEGLFYIKDADTGLVSFYSADGLIVGDKDAEGVIDPILGLLYSGRYSNGQIDLGDGQVIVESEDGRYTAQGKSLASISDPIDKDDTAETENYRLYAYSSYEFAVLDKNTLTKVRDFTVADIIGEEYSANRNIVFALLPDDKLLVQVRVVLPINTTKDYDYYSGSSYYKVNTYIYDLAKGKTSEKKDFEYVVSSGSYYREAGVTLCSVSRIGDDKLLNKAIVQGFDGKLNVALDVQKILPLANRVSVDGDYVVFGNDSRTVYYKGDRKVFEVENNKMNATDMYLADSDIFVSDDENTLFNADGSYITSLTDLDASTFVRLDHAKNYVYYYKIEKNEADISQTNLYKYDRATGVTTMIAKQGSYSMALANYGVYLVEDSSKHGYYNVYDLTDGRLLVSGISSSSAQYVCSTDAGYVIGFTFMNEATMTGETYYYIIG